MFFVDHEDHYVGFLPLFPLVGHTLDIFLIWTWINGFSLITLFTQMNVCMRQLLDSRIYALFWVNCSISKVVVASSDCAMRNIRLSVNTFQMHINFDRISQSLNILKMFTQICSFPGSIFKQTPQYHDVICNTITLLWLVCFFGMEVCMLRNQKFSFSFICWYMCFNTFMYF